MKKEYTYVYYQERWTMEMGVADNGVLGVKAGFFATARCDYRTALDRLKRRLRSDGVVPVGGPAIIRCVDEPWAEKNEIGDAVHVVLGLAGCCWNLDAYFVNLKEASR